MEVGKSITVGIIGGAGFIGSHLADLLIARGHQVIIIDNFSTGYEANLRAVIASKNATVHSRDILTTSDLPSLLRGAHVIVNLAAAKIPRYGQATKTCLVTGQGAQRVLEVAEELGAAVVFASTSDVYGKNPDVPFDEESDSVLGSSSVRRWAYASAKRYAEHLHFAFHEERGVPVSIVRIFGSYGPRNHRSWWGGPQAVFIEAALSGQELEIHGDGSQTRSFSYVSDTVEGFYRVIFNEVARGKLINVGNDEEISIRLLAEKISEIVEPGGEARLKFIPYSTFGRYEDVQRRVPNLTLARDLLGYAPKVNLLEGLRHTVQWHREQVDLS